MQSKFGAMSLAVVCLFSTAPFAFAGDSGTNIAPTVRAMPVLGANEYGTDQDNENNAGTGTADGDMGGASPPYIYNTSSNHPIEFNINIPVNPGTSAATLRMDVYDIDVPDEVDEVYVNGTKLGVLNGADSTWGINQFTLPTGVLKQGNNRIQVLVDRNNSGSWATSIGWGIITLAQQSIIITRAWVTPVNARAGNPVNFYAEVSGKPTSVEVFYGATKLVSLTDAAGNGTFSGAFTLPQGLPTGWFGDLKMTASDGTNQAYWPGVKIVP